MKKIIYFLLIYLTNQCLFSQHSVRFQEPIAPETSNLERYGNTPISEYNGRNNFSIPLYTIKHGDIIIPLSLDYNSNGIRVDEESSEIGLGWNMSSIGNIIQTVNGKNDLRDDLVFQKLDYYSTPYPQSVLIPSPYWVAYSIPHRDRFDPARIALQNSLPDLNKYSIIRLRDDGGYGDAVLFPKNNNELYSIQSSLQSNTNYDFELDVFEANFMGHNISFYKEPSTNFFVVIDNSKYKISYSTEVQNGRSVKVWKIIAPDGVEYYFNEVNSSYSSSFSSVGGSNFPTNTYNYYCMFNNCNYDTTPVNTVWKISKIKDINGNEIVFNYENIATLISSTGNSGYSDFYNIDYDVDFPIAYNCTDYLLYLGPVGSVGQDTDYLYSGKGIRTYNGGAGLTSERSILKEITFGSGKVVFNYDDRNDLPLSKRISSMNVSYNNQNISNIILRNNHFTGNAFINSRMILDGLSINDKDYSFDYYLDTPLPPKNSNSIDYWGYYNGMPNTTIISNPFRLYKNYNDIPEWARTFIPQLDNKANRSSHPLYCKTGMLKQITYPTKGKTLIEYELNEFDNYFFPNYDNKVGVNANNQFLTDYTQNSSKGYGLRISKITDYVDDSKYIVKKYSYFGGKHIPSYLSINQEWHDSYHVGDAINPYGGCATIKHSYGPKITSFYSNSYQSNKLLGNGDCVGYDKVIIEEVSSLGNSNGQIIKYFTNVPDVNARQKFGNGGQPYRWHDNFGYSIRNTDIDNGSLTKEEIYNKTNNLMLKKEYSYSSSVYKNSTSFNVKKGYVGRFINGISGMYNEYLLYYYPLKKTRTKLTGITTTEYFNSGSIYKNESFVYNNNYIQTGKTVTSSNLSYAENTDMLNTSFTLSKNILSTPYKVNTTQNGVVKLSKEYEYLINNNTIQLNKEHVLPDGSPDPNTKVTTFYDLYDNKNNILQYHKNGDIYTSIIWGYNQTLPVAKIENLQYAQIQSGIITEIQQASDSGNETELLAKLNNLRNSLSSIDNVMITTYTHKPLVGLSTILDPKGDKRTFEYDNSNRLKYVKDKDGNILNENEYHFKPQN